MVRFHRRSVGVSPWTASSSSGRVPAGRRSVSQRPPANVTPAKRFAGVRPRARASRTTVARPADRARRCGIPTERSSTVVAVSDVDFKNTVDVISKVIDAAGVAIVIIGLLVATAAFAFAQRELVERRVSYRVDRQQVGKAILLGLEFLVAADIIRTVAVSPSFRGVGVVAVVVAVRTFLSFTLDVELEGRWPWLSQPSSAATARQTPS